ncbi:MAG TPA: VOC family protein [Solirubrobacterales bacterium]|jgi:catechol 2,3-dioxygenase-like lactoylglutathione lyase family enzyme|nr:VOC family protein [Solirubrobacterales bacterium]
MLDHVGIEVSDFERSKAFYLAALAPLGVELVMEPMPGAAGFGSDLGQGPRPYFWIMARGRPTVSGAHVSFAAVDREAVDAFHAAGLAAGGTDNGPPAPRPIYHPGYYGAFVLDPDANNVEAVFHRVQQ